MNSMRWMIFLVLSGLLATSAYGAVKRGLADLYYNPVMKTLGVPGYPATRKPLRYEQSSKLIGQAMRWDPGNPDFLRAHARLLAQRADSDQSDRYLWEPMQPGVKQGYELALRQAQQAVAIRPSSPWLWNDVAQLNTRLGQYDEQMQQSLVNATRLGSLSPPIQLRATQTGLASWSRLNENTQSVLLANIARAMPQNGQEVLEIARTYRQIPVLCEEAHIRRRINRICEQL